MAVLPGGGHCRHGGDRHLLAGPVGRAGAGRHRRGTLSCTACRQLRGRKTDIEDSRWLARICQFSLGRGSLVASPLFRQMRSLEPLPPPDRQGPHALPQPGAEGAGPLRHPHRRYPERRVRQERQDRHAGPDRRTTEPGHPRPPGVRSRSRIA
ncbi:MAG: hypothetical protein OXF73_11930 [Gammaproteobacteria bacterium]|nr:hypothetical protein [Gammaproteobacteria bacterium]MCY4228823.1 hypothetical protein [Gammaproteobacteria bacterium]